MKNKMDKGLLESLRLRVDQLEKVEQDINDLMKKFITNLEQGTNKLEQSLKLKDPIQGGKKSDNMVIRPKPLLTGAPSGTVIPSGPVKDPTRGRRWFKQDYPGNEELYDMLVSPEQALKIKDLPTVDAKFEYILKILKTEGRIVEFQDLVKKRIPTDFK